MEAVAASVVAVLGTLLGSGVTHVLQTRATDRSERFARAERLRQERTGRGADRPGGAPDGSGTTRDVRTWDVRTWDVRTRDMRTRQRDDTGVEPPPALLPSLTQ
ncbi:hypothetical protein [Streptomyces tubercidicus]|uniref:Uncharacterized protein n=1 Tax=Streptomyces tubercidicus TaxID=47759 RepID=A0A640UUR7_9ACTN|nr:hypothetical protein [Streptomyces tubercidicus]WAU16838.1 hypothetical protein STRTU_002729 [Streptomyces tubercidicus]GFE37816.1 hypothetical protein Stube_24890 [Streptomyces tubercidicus]